MYSPSLFFVFFFRQPPLPSYSSSLSSLARAYFSRSRSKVDARSINLFGETHRTIASNVIYNEFWVSGKTQATIVSFLIRERNAHTSRLAAWACSRRFTWQNESRANLIIYKNNRRRIHRHRIDNAWLWLGDEKEKHRFGRKSR